MVDPVLSIGGLAQATGCKVQTIRYYEAIGLLPPPVRTAGNQRRYGRAHRDRLGFVRHARELGFTLDQIRSMLEMSDHPDQSCAEVDELARTHLVEVEARIRRLNALKAELKRMIAACGGGTVADCRIIETLSRKH